jgi:hypothetical protein
MNSIFSPLGREHKKNNIFKSSHTGWTKSSDAARLLARTVVRNDPNQAKGEQILCKEDEIGVGFCLNSRRQNWQSHVFPNLHDAYSSSSSSSCPLFFFFFCFPSYLMLLLSKVSFFSLSHLQQKCKLQQPTQQFLVHMYCIIIATHSTIPSTMHV